MIPFYALKAFLKLLRSSVWSCFLWSAITIWPQAGEERHLRLTPGIWQDVPDCIWTFSSWRWSVKIHFLQGWVVGIVQHRLWFKGCVALICWFMSSFKAQCFLKNCILPAAFYLRVLYSVHLMRYIKAFLVKPVNRMSHSQLLLHQILPQYLYN